MRYDAGYDIRFDIAADMFAFAAAAAFISLRLRHYYYCCDFLYCYAISLLDFHATLEVYFTFSSPFRYDYDMITPPHAPIFSHCCFRHDALMLYA